MKILLLGAEGYVGSAFFDKSRHMFDITRCDIKQPAQPDVLSVSYHGIAPHVVNSHDVVICLAGFSSVKACEDDPEGSWQCNVDYFRWLCNVIQPSVKLIYASSASVYKNGTRMACEHDPVSLVAINHYDMQKTVIDCIASKHILQGKQIIGLRFGTINGPGRNIRTDLMLNAMVKSALTTGKINTKNSHIARPILDIDDLMMVLQRLAIENVEPGLFNVASTHATVGELAEIVAKETNAVIIHHGNDTNVYDFTINTAKIQHALPGLQFNTSASQIVRKLKTFYG